MIFFLMTFFWCFREAGFQPCLSGTTTLMLRAIMEFDILIM